MHTPSRRTLFLAALTLPAVSLPALARPAKGQGGSAAQIARLISAYRAQHGLPGVVADARLGRAAQVQATAMAQAGYVSHTVAGDLRPRLASIGVQPMAAAENIAAGQPSLEAAYAAWAHSSGHSANMLMPQIRRVGVAAASNPGSAYGTFWALVLTD